MESKEYTEAFWMEVGKTFGKMASEQNGELEKAWLRGGVQKLSFSVAIGNTKPPDVKFKLSSTTRKISTELTIPATLPLIN